MTELVSRLLASKSLSHHHNNPPRVLHLRQSENNPNLTTVNPANDMKNASPLYSVIISEKAKPNVLIYRGDPDARNITGRANFHSMSSTADLALGGHQMSLKMSQTSGNFSLGGAPFGKLKWKVNQLTGGSLELYDSSGVKLALMKSTGLLGMGVKKIEILVPCNDLFVDLIVLSGMSAKAYKRAMDDAAAEVIDAIAGI
jgi:hypothetical protein